MSSSAKSVWSSSSRTLALVLMNLSCYEIDFSPMLPVKMLEYGEERLTPLVLVWLEFVSPDSALVWSFPLDFGSFESAFDDEFKIDSSRSYSLIGVKSGFGILAPCHREFIDYF